MQKNMSNVIIEGIREKGRLLRLGIDIGSTTVKAAVLDESNTVLFSDYRRHFANIQQTLADILTDAKEKLGKVILRPAVTGSGGLSISKHLNVPFIQEVVAVATSLQDYAPQCDVAIELGGEDAKIIYFTGGIDQRMNGICAGGTGSFIDPMASLLQADAAGLNEHSRVLLFNTETATDRENYRAIVGNFAGHPASNAV